MDDSDRCCRQHSDCYKATASGNCEPVQINYYAVLYKDKVNCMDADNTCEHRICDCDKLMAECLKGHQETFNETFKNLTKDQCHTIDCNAVCEPFKCPSPIYSTSCTKPKWSKQGITVAGGRENGSIDLILPQGLFIDKNDALYVVEQGNHRVRKFEKGSKASSGGVIVAGGNGRGNGSNQLNNPWDVFVDPLGTLFVTDNGNSRVQQWLANSKEGTTLIGSDHLFNEYYSVSGNKHGDVYYNVNMDIMRYPSRTLVGNIGWGSPVGLFIDGCDNVYVVDSYSGTISKFANSNTTEQILISGLNYPFDVTLDLFDNLYFVETGGHRLQRLSVRDGQLEVLIGDKNNTHGSDAEHLAVPKSVAFDSEWNLFVSDFNNMRVQKFMFEGGDLYC